MSVQKLLDALAIAREMGDTICILGRPGIGKSQIVKQFAESIGVECHVHLLYGDPISVLGIPKLGKEFTEFQKSMLLKCKPGDIIFLDEITNCHMMTVATTWSAISDNVIGGHSFPEGVQFVTAGNNKEHSKSAKDLPKPMISRLVMHEFDGPTPDEFLDYMNSHEWDSLVKAFLHKNPHMISATDLEDDQSPFHCPRQWESVSNLVRYIGYDHTDVASHIISRVGQFAYQKFLTYVELKDKLLNIEDILKDPENIDITALEQDQVAWIQIYMLLDHFIVENFLPITKFIKRLRPEDQVLFIKLVKNDSKLLTEWAYHEDTHDEFARLIDGNKIDFKVLTGQSFS